MKNNLNVTSELVSSNDSQIRAIYNALRRDRPDCVITWSYIRSEVLLTAATGTIKFPILVNDQPAANVNERRLNISDEFQIVQMGIFIYKKPNTSAIETCILQTYPNPFVFDKSGEAGALQALYNGFLSLTIDRKQLIPYFDAMQFFKVPDAQAGTTTAAIAGPTQYKQANSAYLDASWGLIDSIPSVRLSGSVVNEVYLAPPTSQDMSGTSSVNYAVFFARGFLIQNGAQFTSKNKPASGN